VQQQKQGLMSMVKSAIEKMQTPHAPKIVEQLPEGVRWAPPGSSMVISTPLEIEGLINKIPKGKVATIATLREAIAKRHKTTITCPITTGIFLGVIARAAAEKEMLGVNHVTPWWRVLKTDGSLNDKMPGGTTAHKLRLVAEGFEITAKNKSTWIVSNFAERIAKL
jgi:alkylated DNA nucleotide flippase Atl1